MSASLTESLTPRKDEAGLSLLSSSAINTWFDYIFLNSSSSNMKSLFRNFFFMEQNNKYSGNFPFGRNLLFLVNL